MNKLDSQLRLPPLKSLQVFEVSARVQSFKIAADELFVTPAAVSHQIQILEEFLDVKLFERENKGIILSDDGKLIYPTIKNAFQLIHEVVNTLHSRDVEKNIKLTAGPAFTTKWLANNVPVFMQSHPEISIDLDASLSIFDFRKSGIDIAIRFGKPTHVDGVVNIPLIEEAVIPVVSPSLIEKLGRPLLPSDLTNCELIHDRSLSMVKEGFPFWQEWQTWLDLANIHDVNAQKGVVFNHADHAIKAAIEGGGIALARVVLAASDIKCGRLVMPFGPMIPSGLSFYLLVRNEIAEKIEITIFIEWLKVLIKRDIQLVSDIKGDSLIANLLKI